MTQPEAVILAARIAAGAAILSTLASLVSAVMASRITTRVSELNRDLQKVIADKTREAELVVNALNHLVGGSQERTAGLAALNMLRVETPLARWTGYENFVRTLLATQLIYVLTAGANRWQAHEVENVRQMTEWFMENGKPNFGDFQSRVRSATDTYIADWGSRRRDKSAAHKEEWEKEVREGRPNAAAVTGLITDLKSWLNLRSPDAKTAPQ